MLGWLKNLDQSVIDWVATSVYTPSQIRWLRLLTDTEHIYPLALALICILIVQKKIRGLFIILHIVLVLALTNFVSSEMLKHSIQRGRPCTQNPPPGFALSCGNLSPSFPSSHAANTMAVAVTAFNYNFIYGSLLLVASGATGVSRVYTGTHFPSDVVVGWLLGLVIGLVINRLLHYVMRFIGLDFRRKL